MKKPFRGLGMYCGISLLAICRPRILITLIVGVPLLGLPIVPAANAQNQSLLFNGANQYAEFIAPANLPGGSAARTVEFWMRSSLRDGAYQNHEPIVNLGSQAHDGAAFGLFTHRDAGRTMLGFWGHNADNLDLAWIRDDQWHFVAVTYEEPYLTTYLDGEWQSSHEIVTAVGGHRLNTTTDRGYIGGYPERGWYFEGAVDNLMIWDAVRTEFQIRQDMAAYPALKGNEPGLVAFFAFDEGSGSTFSDLTGTCTGTLHNQATWTKPIDKNPSLASEGIWFVMQSKSDVDTDYGIPAMRKAVKVDDSGRLSVGTIPLTGDYDEFLWRLAPIPDGGYKIYNKKWDDDQVLDSSQDYPQMASAGNYSGQQWNVTPSNPSTWGLNAYTLTNSLVTDDKSVANVDGSVVIVPKDPSATNQAWVFQPMDLVLGYHISSVSSEDYNPPYSKVLTLDLGNTLYATNTTSDWAVLNAHSIYNNVMNAFADSDTKPDSKAKRTFYLFSRHDFQPCYYAPTWYNCRALNAWRGYGGNETGITEEMMSRRGVYMRGPMDGTYREFEQVVHEFGHTLERQYFRSMNVSGTTWAESWGVDAWEWYPWQVQYWFNSAQSEGPDNNRASLPADVAEFMQKMFSPANSWLPPRMLRDKTVSETDVVPTFYADGTMITPGRRIYSDQERSYYMLLQDDGNMVIYDANDRFQWGSFDNLGVRMRDVRGVYFKGGKLYFTTTTDINILDRTIASRLPNPNADIVHTIDMYAPAAPSSTRLVINSENPTRGIQVINITPGDGVDAPEVLWPR